MLFKVPANGYFKENQKTILLFGFKNPYKKICETRKLEFL